MCWPKPNLAFRTFNSSSYSMIFYNSGKHTTGPNVCSWTIHKCFLAWTVTFAKPATTITLLTFCLLKSFVRMRTISYALRQCKVCTSLITFYTFIQKYQHLPLANL